MKYLFGPVHSRRLGRSLGIDPIPAKTCSLDCVYCECGPTTHKTLERHRFYETEAVLDELERALARYGSDLDWVTFAGSGEPTLAENMGEILQGARRLGAPRIAVLTNSTLMTRSDVREELAEADRICPSLDAVTKEGFQRVNRPCPGLQPGAIVEALQRFQRGFRGELHLEILLVEGMNDAPAEIEALSRAVARIRPDRVELGTVARPGTEAWARPVSAEHLRRIADRLGPSVDLIHYTRARTVAHASAGEEEERILELIRRRPATVRQIATGLGLRMAHVQKILSWLEQEKRVVRRERAEGAFFQPPREGSVGSG